MALTINEINNVFKVEGSINATTAKTFKTHLEMIMNAQGELTIDIDNVTEIDQNGLVAIKALYHNALIYSRESYILGNGCRELYDDFKSHMAAA